MLATVYQLKLSNIHRFINCNCISTKIQFWRLLWLGPRWNICSWWIHLSEYFPLHTDHLVVSNFFNASYISIKTLAAELNKVLRTESFFVNWEFKWPVLCYCTTNFARAEIILSESNPILNFVKFLYMNTSTQIYVDVSHVNSPLKFCKQIFVFAFMRSRYSDSAQERSSVILSAVIHFYKFGFMRVCRPPN